MIVEREHAAAGCNRVVHALDWGQDELVAFAAHNTVILYSVQAGRVTATLLGHSKRVACVRWIPSQVHCSGSRTDGLRYLASGGSDHSIIVWAVSTGRQCVWQRLAVLQSKKQISAGGDTISEEQGHSGPVSSLAFHTLPNGPPGSFMLLSTAGDGDVLCWKCLGVSDEMTGDCCDQGAWSLVQRFSLGQNIPTCVDVTHIPEHPDWLILAIGSADSCVRIMVQAPEGKFVPACTLKGHENWITSAAFTHAVQKDGTWQVWLATSSQDRNLRIWSIVSQQQMGSGTPSQKRSSVAFLTAFADKLTFQAAQLTLEASISAVLVGHEDWVHSVAWQPSLETSGCTSSAPKLPCLLSASMDRSMMIWEADLVNGLWMCVESMGDAGADSLGYFGGVWSPDSKKLLAHGYTGALHLWERSTAEPGSSTRGASLIPRAALTGHWDEISDMKWGVDGECLLTVSADQTARIWSQSADGWYEMARPQVHGHNFSSIANIAQREPWKFVIASSSEEKVIRILEAPVTFLNTLAAARGTQVPAHLQSDNDQRPIGSTVGALGLSNKAVYKGDETESGRDGQYEPGPDLAPCAHPAAIIGRPLEEHLSQSSLWPETHKLYGHGNDVYTLAACPMGSCLVSACKAQTGDAAELIVWDVRSPDYDTCQRLPGHNLTVTQMAFSDDGRFIGSVSRDRSFCIWKAVHDPSGDDKPNFERVGHIPRAHDRIIWTVSWAPGSHLFVTGSRDKVLRWWSFDPEHPEVPVAPALSQSKLPAAVTAIAFAPVKSPSMDAAGHPDGQHKYNAAVGFENGELKLMEVVFTSKGLQATEIWQAPEDLRHSAAVKGIEWKRLQCGAMHMATCGSDHTLKIFKVQL